MSPVDPWRVSDGIHGASEPIGVLVAWDPEAEGVAGRGDDAAGDRLLELALPVGHTDLLPSGHRLVYLLALAASL